MKEHDTNDNTPAAEVKGQPRSTGVIDIKMTTSHEKYFRDGKTTVRSDQNRNNECRKEGRTRTDQKDNDAVSWVDKKDEEGEEDYELVESEVYSDVSSENEEDEEFSQELLDEFYLCNSI